MRPIAHRMTAPAIAGLAVLLAALPATAQQLSVEMDKARTIALAAPAAAVVIGNPLIADAGILDQQTLVLTGKSYGVTNMIVIDANGRHIYSADLTVVPASSSSTALVSLHRGAQRSSYTCAGGGACQTTPMVGDAQEVYTVASDQRAAQIDAARSAASQ